MKPAFSIRRLEPSDTKRLRALLSTREDVDEEAVDRRVALVEWAAFGNPHADGEATYFVAEQGGELIAHMGRMPSIFRVNGQKIKGYYVHDLYVHPEHRDRGKGLMLTVALYKTTQEQSGSFCVLVWATKLNIEIQRRLGYTEGHLQNYVKLLKVEPVLRKVVSNDTVARALGFLPNLVLRGLDAVRLKRRNKLTRVVAIERFDNRFDQLTERISPVLGIHSIKDVDTLNWKYADRPYHDNRIFAALRGDEVIGFIVVIICTTSKPTAVSGMIVDLMADPRDEDTVSALVAEAVGFCRRKGAEIVQCIMTQPEFAGMLTKHLFLRRESWRQPLMLGNLEKCPAYENILADPSKWHMIMGESDGVLFF